ncbi:MAG: hypothetical protein NT137_08010 [Methanomassiliicoccales archaeon]|nr:hypothetical protein [Methanomassiliicoccales archaeon]
MDRREKVTSVIRLVGGKTQNAKRIVDEVDILDNLNAELEDWWARSDMNGEPAGLLQSIPDQSVKTCIN